MTGRLRHPLAWVAAAILGLIVLAKTVAVVPEYDQAVILRLENPLRTINEWHAGEVFGATGAGIDFRVPFFDRLVWVDKRILFVDYDHQQVLSSDQQPFEVDAFARFRITNPLKAVTATGSTSTTETQVANALQPLLGSSLRAELGNETFTTLLTPERDKVMANIQTRLQKLASQYGVQIVDVRIKHADLPQGSPLDSALKRMATARQQQAVTIRAQGQKDALIIQAQADADAARIYAASFSKDPGFYDFYRAMQSYKATFGVGLPAGTQGQGSTAIILSPNNSYLRQFEGRAGAARP